tara:strand:- start:15720 stop:16946 length:1227 start_codon:yes stop_codon:yes gene_type:complete
MATVFNQYLTRYIIGLLNEYGHFQSANEKKFQRDDLTGQIRNLTENTKDLIPDNLLKDNLLQIIREYREDTLKIARKTAGVSTGQFEKYCDLAIELTSTIYTLFEQHHILDINTKELVANLQIPREKYRFECLLIKRLLLEYIIIKAKTEGMKSYGLDSAGYYKSYIQSYFPNLDIASQKQKTISDGLQSIETAFETTLSNIDEKTLKRLNETLKKQVEHLLRELRDTHGSTKPSISLSITSMALNAFSSYFVTPGDGYSEKIVLFILETLFPVFIDSDKFNDIPKETWEVILTSSYTKIHSFLNGSIGTKPEHDSASMPNSSFDARALGSITKQSAESDTKTQQLMTTVFDQKKEAKPISPVAKSKHNEFDIVSDDEGIQESPFGSAQTARVFTTTQRKQTKTQGKR